LDLCAAPGTKTTYIGEYTNDRAKIIANDISESKNHLIRENIERLKLNNIIITNFDAARLKEEYIEKFDYILCDAPCSGLGVMGKKPEIRYNRNIEDIKELSKLQRDILDSAVKYLKKGGFLVYSTCTLGYEENIKNFNYLMDMKELKNCPISGKKYLEYANHIDHTDGFFIAKFEKK
jgi:16S rRNA (cytosine967-C5)-methyltransferase